MTIDREELEWLYRATSPNEVGNRTLARAELSLYLRNAVPDILALLDENDGLKRDVDQQMAIANSEANLAEELRAENAALAKCIEELEAAIKKVLNAYRVTGGHKACSMQDAMIELCAALNQTDGGEDAA